mgnify:FL=1
MSPEYENSWEHLSSEERRKRIAAHISDMRIGHRVLEESHAQQEAIQDFEARIYQLDAFNVLWTARRDGADRGLIHLATGLGKTSVAVVDYAAFRQEQIARTGQEPRALFVVHQNNILEQADERFAELLPDASRSFYSNRQRSLPESGVTFASFQALSNGAHRFPEDYFDYIIYDEAHHTEATTYKKVVEYFKPQFQLGLTATPERMDEKDITEHFGEALYTKSLPEAIAEKHLATVNYNIVFDDAIKEAMQNGFEPSSLAEIQRLFEVQPRNEVIVDKIREAQELIRHEQDVERVKTIIFCADLEHADAIADMMEGESYHSGKAENQQAGLLNAFRGNELETITVRDMFNEGVDIPDARLIVFLRTTQSATIFEQQLGRGLRKNKNKQEVTVLDFVANIERITLIRELVKNIDTVRPLQNKKDGDSGGDRSGHSEEGVSRTDENIKVHGNDSEFIFSQEIINLLDKYDALQEKNKSREKWVEWTDEAIADLARSISPDAPLSATRMSELSKVGVFPNHKTIAERFGSITNFQRFCGFEILNWSEYTRSEIIELARDLSPDKYMIIDDINTYSKMKLLPSQAFIAEMFGSLRQFQKEAWGREWTDWKQYSPEQLIELALELSPDKPLTTKTIEELSKNKLFPYQSVISEAFGSLREFQIRCGFNQRENWAEYSVEELTAKLKALSPNTPLTNPMINRLSKEGLSPAASTIVSIYGSFANMQRACGFDAVERTNWSKLSDDELVSVALAISPDKNLTSAQVVGLSKEGKFMSNSMLFRRFGSIKAFHDLCDRKRIG